MRRIMKISKGGQISIPAAIRKRWGTNDVRVIDEGKRLIVEPAADDANQRAIDNAYGALAPYFEGVDLKAAWAEYKDEERELAARQEEEKYGPA